MEKVNEENAQTSPDHEALKIEEIGKNNVDFSLVKIEVEEKPKEKDSCLDELSPVRVEPDSMIISDDSDSMGYNVSSDNNGLSYSNWTEWPPLTVVPISSIEPENFKETIEETMPIENKPSKMVGVGMYNLGNTCFLNAVVQCFMHTVVLLQLLASIDHVSLCDNYTTGFCVVCIIQDLLDLSMCGAFDYVSPKKIASHLRDFSPDFDWYQQEDAHEFLQCFLNQLENCCYNLETQDNIVKEAFGGLLVSKLRCCNCGNLSVTREPLIDISLEIEDVDSVPAALGSFTKIEKIEFSCERCKTQGPFEKQLLVDRAPSVAALHLKRFKNNEIVVEKMDKHVSIPLELDMLLYTNEINNEEMKYDLYAIIVHSGPSISSGHYYSFIRCAPNEWYKFDDEKVLWVHEDVVLAEEAYIMFYAKRGTAWFSDYNQIQRPFINLVIPITSPCIRNNHTDSDADDAADETSLKPELNKIEDNNSPDQVYCEDQLKDVEIKQVCSSDEEFMDALCRSSHVSCVNEKKRKLEDSPSRDD